MHFTRGQRLAPWQTAKRRPGNSGAGPSAPRHGVFNSSQELSDTGLQASSAVMVPVIS